MIIGDTDGKVNEKLYDSMVFLCYFFVSCKFEFVEDILVCHKIQFSYSFERIQKKDILILSLHDIEIIRLKLCSKIMSTIMAEKYSSSIRKPFF